MEAALWEDKPATPRIEDSMRSGFGVDAPRRGLDLRRRLRELAEGGGYLVAAEAHLVESGDDLGDPSGHVGYRLGHGTDRFGAPDGQFVGPVDARDRALETRGDFLGVDGGGLGQLAYLVGDHAEAPAVISGVGGLYGGIHGEEIGLIRDALDDARGLGDRVGGV